MTEELLTTSGKFKCKVSSTLQPSSLYASKHMFDDSHDTLWNSDQGSPQWILLDFTEPVSFSSIAFTFQGGFVGQEAAIEIGETSATAFEPVLTIYSILDNNNLQKFSLIPNSETTPRKGRYLKITFPSSTDFYGRVTIYSLQVFGTR